MRYAGNYDDYRVQRARADEARAQELARLAAAPARDKLAAKEAPKPKGLTYAERIELDGIMDRIDAAERAVADLDARLADPALYATRGGEVPGAARRSRPRQDRGRAPRRPVGRARDAPRGREGLSTSLGGAESIARLRDAHRRAALGDEAIGDVDEQLLGGRLRPCDP